MVLQPFDYVVYAWLAIAIVCAIYVAVDQFRGNPEAPVMKWGFVLITLYMGPIGLLLYIMADKEPRKGTHEEFVQPLWKQGVGSTVHCIAGDATGIISAATVTALLGLPMWVDLLVEYTFGFLFGLLIFQSLFMRAMMGGSYLENVRRSFLPELLSMNMMMSAMAPVMIVMMMGRDMRAMWPGEPLFWFVMSIGVTAGFFIAYPINVWMVSKNLKHGLMTVRGGPAKAKTKAKEKEMDGMEGMEGMAGMDHSAKSGASGASGVKHGEQSGAFAVTTPQRAALIIVTTLALLSGMYIPAAFFNLRISGDQVKGAIMPPGTISVYDTPADAMRDMAAADPREITYRAAPDARGDRPLVPRIENGVKVFDFEASVIQWNILPGRTVTAYAINHQVPGPRLEFTEGDRVRINFTNHLPVPTTMHWHGLIVPNAMDGPANITQRPIMPGETFTYEYEVKQAGTYFYHSHAQPDRQQALGLYGALIIRPRIKAEEPAADYEYVVQLQEWLVLGGLTYPAMIMDGALPNFFTINGKSYPATDTLRMRVGQTVKFRFIGTNNNFIHPMHMHGGPFTVVARDGILLPPGARFQADVINVGPGQRYDVIWPALEPGKWIMHCHIPHHTLNNNVEEQGAGGLTLLVEVTR
ncbi:MAG: multicopper oxidase domain-containing protein [Gemmatimonadota bacterium]|nr:multicopper oxidase domain-containing protein [Gemmatimonadota bacterium]